MVATCHAAGISKKASPARVDGQHQGWPGLDWPQASSQIRAARVQAATFLPCRMQVVRLRPIAVVKG